MEEIVEVTEEKEKALLEVLRFKVTHCSAVSRFLTKSRGEEVVSSAEKSLQKFIKKLLDTGFSQEIIERKIYNYWRFAEAVYNGKKVKDKI